MASEAHNELRARYERREFTVAGLAEKLGCTTNAIRFILSGTTPKVTIALALERELGIPIAMWEGRSDG